MFTRAARMSPGQVPGTDRRRVLTLLGATSAVGSIGLAAGGTAGALLGARLAGTEAAAGLPLGLLVLGSGAFALLVSWQTTRIGRGGSLAAGYAAEAAGAARGVPAASHTSVERKPPPHARAASWPVACGPRRPASGWACWPPRTSSWWPSWPSPRSTS